MSREIKFRVWTGTHMEYKVMAGHLGHFYVAGMNERDSACMSEFNTIYHDETPLMQYTGLKDKNGREIYEGDIMFCVDDAQYYKIVFLDGMFLLEVSKKDYSPIKEYVFDSQVVGNIHQNPELIK